MQQNNLQSIEALGDSLRALFAAAQYAPQQLNLNGINLFVHNQAISTKLHAQYSLQQFQQLFSFCEDKGVFALKINANNGLVQTSDVAENWDMSGRQWVTDTVRCGDLQRVIDPKSWQKALLTLAEFYNQPEERAAIEHSINDPDYFRQGKLTNGVAHIFIPDTLKRDPGWRNNKRLESHGLALKALCDALYNGLVLNKVDGINTDLLYKNGADKKIVQAISGLASYLKAINTNSSTYGKSDEFDFAAPSAGPWEEIPFAGGLTWDTEAMRSGFESLRNLLFEPSSSDTLDELRQALMRVPQSSWMADRQVLDRLIASAHAKIMDRLWGSAHPMDHPQRPIDSALAFISNSTICMHRDTIEDVSKHFKLLQFLEEHIVRDNGMIRYAPFLVTLSNGKSEHVFDAYLADNYWLMPELREYVTGQNQNTDRDFGSTDCSTADDFVSRTQLSRPNKEAQWCWVSVMAEGYCRQTAKLLQQILTESRHATEEEMRLITHGHNKAAEYINRSYARITGTMSDDSPSIKANGKVCRDFAVPEAYEHVSLLESKDGATVLLPGANTPLAWAASSLFSASKHFAHNLQMITELSSQGMLRQMELVSE